MARYGRGQPHAPILLRGTSTVPPRLAPQITIILTSSRRSRTEVRNGSGIVIGRGKSTVPLRLAPQVTVVLATRQRTRDKVRNYAQFIFRRNPQVPVVAAPLPAPQIHVILHNRRADRQQVREHVGIRFGRNALVPPPVVIPAPKSHIILQTRRRTAASVRDTSHVVIQHAPWWGTIGGITRDNTGAPLGDCVVHLFRTLDDLKMATTGSDNLGNYAFTLIKDATTYYCVAYKAGVVTGDRTLPTSDTSVVLASGLGGTDVAGTTLNTLMAA